MTNEIDRVMVWNSYLIEARQSANKLRNGEEFTPEIDLLGGFLDAEEHYIVSTIIHTVLAAEARANHLLHILSERNIISKELRECVKHRNLKQRWLVLPELAKSKDRISYNDIPHSCISKLQDERDKFIHVKYEHTQFINKIPSKEFAIENYNQFISAMADMNKILGLNTVPAETIKSMQV